MSPSREGREGEVKSIFIDTCEKMQATVFVIFLLL